MSVFCYHIKEICSQRGYILFKCTDVNTNKAGYSTPIGGKFQQEIVAWWSKVPILNFQLWYNKNGSKKPGTLPHASLVKSSGRKYQYCLYAHTWLYSGRKFIQSHNDSELSTMVWLNVWCILYTINNNIQPHGSWRFHIRKYTLVISTIGCTTVESSKCGTFGCSATISPWNFWPMVCEVIHQVFLELFWLHHG